MIKERTRVTVGIQMQRKLYLVVGLCLETAMQLSKIIRIPVGKKRFATRPLLEDEIVLLPLDKPALWLDILKAGSKAGELRLDRLYGVPEVTLRQYCAGNGIPIEEHVADYTQPTEKPSATLDPALRLLHQSNLGAFSDSATALLQQTLNDLRKKQDGQSENQSVGSSTDQPSNGQPPAAVSEATAADATANDQP